MTNTEFYALLLKNFPYSPTHGQKKLLWELAKFVTDDNQNSLFLLKGYAGTGKTTVISILVRHLFRIQKKSVLLAPTGRAAKVLAAYSGKQAFTIHKKIYLFSAMADRSTRMVLAQNKHTNTLFFVDESSMIPAGSPNKDSLFSGRDLLGDLTEYVYSGKNCKLVLIGDTAQLPPVGLELSPALDIEYLKRNFHFSIGSNEIKEVVRQSLDSGILANATEIRNHLDQSGYYPFLYSRDFDDIILINGEQLEDELNTAFTGGEDYNSVVITRSNKRANIFNREIRNRVLFRENEIAAGDLLMVVKNNYFWVDENSGPNFIANGDMIEIQRIDRYENLYGYSFADVTIRFTDYPDEKEISLKIMLNTINLESPSLSHSEMIRFFEEAMKDYEDTPSRKKRIEKVRNNPYFNALQVKFAYALTCHKTQGGQWENVFIDLGYIREEMLDMSFYRWLYTAFTRATRKLYLINFPEKFLKQKTEA